jgi:hypothetical protein
VGWLIVVGSTVLIAAILAGMIWQWCNTSDWQDRYW